MKNHLGAAAFALAIASVAQGIEPGSPLFDPRDRTMPRPWVPLSDIVGIDGRIDLSGFQPYQASAIRLALKPLGDQGSRSPSSSPLNYIEACGKTAVTTSGGRSPERSLEEVYRNAKSAFTGRIVSATPGFLEGTPGSLLELSSVEIALGTVRAEGSVYVFFPFAHVIAGNQLLCKSDLRYTLRPQVGDTLVVLASSSALDKGASLFQPGPSQIFLETQGQIQAGPYLTNVPLPSSAVGLIERAKAVHADGADK